MNKNKSKKDNVDTAISCDPNMGQPETAFELINKYGTYEIQPTCDSDNEFPAIAQGSPKEKRK